MTKRVSGQGVALLTRHLVIRCTVGGERVSNSIRGSIKRNVVSPIRPVLIRYPNRKGRGRRRG